MKKLTRSVSNPIGAWPLEMRSETAAAYCDEPSVEAFLSKVTKGIYPPPARSLAILKLKMQQH